MNWRGFFTNPIYELCALLAKKRNLPLEMVVVRSSYNLFPFFKFSEEELLYVYYDMVDSYIKTLDVVLGNYRGLEEKFISPSKRLNVLFIHISGFVEKIMVDENLVTKCRVPLINFPELMTNHHKNIKRWEQLKPDYQNYLSQIKRDLVLNTRYDSKPIKLFPMILNTLNKELNAHLEKRNHEGVDMVFDYSLPANFKWLDDKTYILGDINKIVFEKDGQPLKVFKAMTDANGQWVEKSKLIKFTDSEDSLRSVMSSIRKIIKDNKVIGIKNDNKGHYRVALCSILSPVSD